MRHFDGKHSELCWPGLEPLDKIVNYRGGLPIIY